MECQVCHGKMEQKGIKFDMWIEEELTVIDNVPGFECSMCGEQVFSPEVAEKISNIQKEKAEEIIEVKLKHFPHEVTACV